jgi:hypothetical protein
MKAFLMYRDRDFDPKAGIPLNAPDLTADLELEILFRTMSAGDPFLLEVAKQAVLASLYEPDAILYRQRVLADCLNHPAAVRELYSIAVEAIEGEKKQWGWMSGRYPEGTLHRAIDSLKMLAGLLKRLKKIADEHRAAFRSAGFQRFFEMIGRELDGEYLGTVEKHLQTLAFRNGILMSAELGSGNKGIDYVLRSQPELRLNWLDRVRDWLKQITGRKRSNYTYQLADRDEAGAKALSELRSQGIGHIAAALAQSTDHILSFFNMLRLELGFYLCCLNLRDRLARSGQPFCMPEPVTPGDQLLSAGGLYDICLSLGMDNRVTANDIAGDRKPLVIITGANRGGKSTFLRSLGIAQLMMQCGMFVPAESLRASVCYGLFTHFKREEDSMMRSGKLDEELGRMSGIVDKITPDSIVLLNESFASTNEREGSEIARQVVRALVETRVKVFYVTHMFELAEGFYREKMNGSLFLRAERLPDGRRTFRLVEGEPLPTSYGEDLYRRIFAPSGQAHLALKDLAG